MSLSQKFLNSIGTSRPDLFAFHCLHITSCNLFMNLFKTELLNTLYML